MVSQKVFCLGVGDLIQSNLSEKGDSSSPHFNSNTYRERREVRDRQWKHVGRMMVLGWSLWSVYPDTSQGRKIY